jgi:DNA-binding MarR family transcriptional regulator
MPNPTELKVTAWYAVGRNYQRCMSVLAHRVATLGLSLTEHEVAQHLLLSPGLSQQQLTGRVFMVKSHLSAVVREMEGRGLVSRTADPADGRAWSLSLTAQGADLAARAKAVQMGLIEAMSAGVGAPDMAQFSTVLHAIEKNLIVLKDEASKVAENARA